MTAEVSRGLVLGQQGAQSLQQALRGAVFGDGPHRVVSRHQQEVGLGCRHPLLEPLQLPVGVHEAHRAAGLLVLEVVGVPAQQHGVHHQDGERAVGARHAEVQLVVVVGEVPGWRDNRGNREGRWKEGNRKQAG